MENKKLDNLRSEIANLVAEYSKEKFKAIPFIGGETVIPPSGKINSSRRITKHGICFFGWLVDYWEI